MKGGPGSRGGEVCAISNSIERALESVSEKTGNLEGRICFTKTNSVAAGGANASAFAPTAASPSLVPVFSLRDSQQTGRI